ncbi:MAG: ferredoxin-thioredoxin reductase variable chain [Cyanobacteria bacterium P01_E01_bin.6]
MKVGDRIRVSESVVVYHHPSNRNEPFDIKGHEGEVIGIASEWHGKAISANFPVLVKFEKKFKAHLREDEIEQIEAS